MAARSDDATDGPSDGSAMEERLVSDELAEIAGRIEGEAAAAAAPAKDAGSNPAITILAPSPNRLLRAHSAWDTASAGTADKITPGKDATGISRTLETLELTASTAERAGDSLRLLTPSPSAGSLGKNVPGTEAKQLRDLNITFISKPVSARKRPTGRNTTLLVIAMRKKVMSKPMFEIMSRLVRYNELDICVLEEEMLLEGNPDEWPGCDALIAFASKKYPLEKVEKYANRVKPMMLNDLSMQHRLQDRRDVFRLLRSNGVPVPKHVVVSDAEDVQEGGYSWDEIEERDDAIYSKKTGALLLQRPFVEKPVDCDDHNIRIYFHADDGGGCQVLFRKTNNRCSEYLEGDQPIQRGGARIYEEFIATGGTDIKCYTVSAMYVHAEGRKAPVVDGQVLRDASGKEIRCPILLSAEEKRIARRVVEIFKQEVCGFDLLRAEDVSYVCDVNGWSFVKQSRSYFEDCARLICGLIMARCHRPPTRTSSPNILSAVPAPREKPAAVEGPAAGPGNLGELVCVIAIVRHGERTPKQKSKHKSTRQEWIDVYTKYSDDPEHKKELKIKHPKHLTCAMQAAAAILASKDASDEERARCEIILEVLQRFPLQGINRKLQIKPLAWVDGLKAEQDVGDGAIAGGQPLQQVTKVHVVLKWGGWLTESGLRQSRLEGEKFRKSMYVDDAGGGLLRLHSTYRHNLKVHSSDEGRVQTTAAAFAKGLLGLDGSIPPILASMISKGKSVNALLDDCSMAKGELHAVKEKLHILITKDTPVSELHDLNPQGAVSIAKALDAIGNPYQALVKLEKLVATLLDKLSPCNVEGYLYDGESHSGMCDRWSKVYEEFVKKSMPPSFNVSKVPDLYDCSRYDCLHNALPEIKETLWDIYTLSKSFASVIVPQEYGMTKHEKASIAKKITSRLRTKLIRNLRVAADLPTEPPGEPNSPQLAKAHDNQVNRFNSRGAGFLDRTVRSPERFVRSRIYVTSESHCYAMMDLLRYCGYDELVQANADDRGAEGEDGRRAWREGLEKLSSGDVLGELTQVVCRVYERRSPGGGTKAHFVEWLISTGLHPPSCDDPSTATDVAPMMQLHHGMPLAHVERFLEGSA